MACLAHNNPDVAFDYAGNSNRVARYDPERTARLMDWCDHIVTQPVMNPENPDHHDALRTRFAGKITFMPYIWVDGLFSVCRLPETQFRTAEEAGFVGETHVTDHLQRAGFAQTLLDFRNGDINFQHAGRFARSVTELARRESFADVSVKPFILQHYRDQEVMLTHNHPHPVLVNEIARQIAARLGLVHRPITPDNHAAYSDITLPEFGKVFSPHVVRDLGLRTTPDLQWLRQGQMFIAEIADRMAGLADRASRLDMQSRRADRQALIDEKQVQAEALKAQSDDLRRQNQVLRGQSAERQALIADRQSQNETLRQQNAEMKAQNEALRLQTIDRKTQNVALRVQNAEKQALIAERQALKDSVQQQSAQQRALKAGQRAQSAAPARSPDDAPQPLPLPAGHATKGHAGDLP